jgi:hypothetical protein
MKTVLVTRPSLTRILWRNGGVTRFLWIAGLCGWAAILDLVFNHPVLEVFWIPCIISAVIAYACAARLRALHKIAVLVEAQIIDCRRGIKGPGKFSYRFDYGGDSYSGKQITFQPSKWKTGNSVTVAVDPNNPSCSDVIDLYL